MSIGNLIMNFNGSHSVGETRHQAMPFTEPSMVLGPPGCRVTFVRVERAYEKDGHRFVWFDMQPAETLP